MRPHLVLLTGGRTGSASSTDHGPGPASFTHLATRVVEAAQAYAAELDVDEQDVMEELPSPATPAQYALRNLRDAVHDLDFHTTAPPAKSVAPALGAFGHVPS